jgi:hypothetical protein
MDTLNLPLEVIMILETVQFLGFFKCPLKVDYLFYAIVIDEAIGLNTCIR